MLLRDLSEVILDVLERLIPILCEGRRYISFKHLIHQELDKVQLKAVIVGHENFQLLL